MSNELSASAKTETKPWGFRVRELRMKAGLTQEELAERLGTTKATISKMERASNPPKIDWLRKISAEFDVHLATLMGLDGFEVTPDRPSYIPVIGMIAAGNWREAIHNPDDQIPVVNAKPYMFALKVDGDSIDRVAPDGSFVVIDAADPSLADGSIYAVQNADGDTTLKRFRRSPDRLEPDSTNPVHKAIMLGGEAITIIGRATQVIQTL